MRALAVRTLLAMLMTAQLLLAAGAPVQAAAQWQGSDGGWRGTGAAFLPGGTYIGDTPGSGDNCAGCSWEAMPVCELTGPNNCQDSFGCPAGQPFVLIRLTSPALGMTVTVGSECLRQGEPLSVAEAEQWVQSAVRQSAPELTIGTQPRPRTLTNLPTIFWTTQPQSIERGDSLAGHAVTFRANAQWHWRWGDGSQGRTTSVPGSPWPNHTLSHIYRRPGEVNVAVTTRWNVVFWVNGVGPFSVTGEPVTQTQTQRVQVQEARAVLVG